MTLDQWNEMEVKIREVVEAMLAKEYPEMSVLQEGLTYSPTSCKFKINVQNLKLGFKRSCEMFGFKEEDYGKSFINGRKRYQLIGFSPSKSSYPIMCRQEDGTITNFRELDRKILKDD